MPTDFAGILLWAGRILTGGVFLYGGLHHFTAIPPLVEAMTQRGVPSPRAALFAGSIFQALLGLMLILGVYVAPAALGLVLFTIAATIMFLNFWDMTGPARDGMKNGFSSNIAIIGGLLVIAAEAM